MSIHGHASTHDPILPASALAAQLQAVGPGDHLCAIVDDDAQLVATAVAFLRLGFDRGERCVAVVGQAADGLLDGLTAAGVDVAAERDRGALVVMSLEETYIRAGGFEPVAMIGHFDAMVSRAITDGFTGLRVVGDMAWAVEPVPGRERLIEYEALLSQFFPGNRVTGLCLYRRASFEPGVLRDALRTHALAVLGDELCPNPFYEPPEIVLDRAPAHERVDWTIAQLRQLRAAQARLAEAARESAAEGDRFLSVAVHEMRTPLTSVKANAQLL